MPYITRDIPENDLARETMGGQLPSTLGETLHAAISDPTLRPTQQAYDNLKRNGLRATDKMTPGQAMMVGAIDKLSSAIGWTGHSQDQPVDPAQLNAQYKSLGLHFDHPVTQSYADSIAQGKRQEMIRNDIMARGPHGVTASALKFGAQFAGAAVDPINIASAFIPVVGEARYAGMLARYGKTGARLVRGMAEGAVGNAAIEPINYGLAKQSQLDYSLADSAVNIALGGFLGGGLHAVGGRIGDFVSSRRPHVREQALKSSVAQMAEGKMPDVEHIFSMDDRASAMRIAMGLDEPQTKAPASDFMAHSPTRDRISGIKAQLLPIAADKLSRGDAKALETQIGTLEHQRQQKINEPLAPTKRNLKQRVKNGAKRLTGRNAEKEARRLHEADIAAIDEHLSRAKDQLNRHHTAASAESVLSRIETRQREGVPFSQIYDEVRQSMPDLPPLAPTEPAQPLTADAVRKTTAEVARHEQQPQRDITADFQAASRITQTNKAPRAKVSTDRSQWNQDAEDDAKYAADNLEQMRAAGQLTKADEEEIKMLNDMVTHAKAYQEAARVGAQCVAS